MEEHQDAEEVIPLLDDAKEEHCAASADLSYLLVGGGLWPKASMNPDLSAPTSRMYTDVWMVYMEAL